MKWKFLITSSSVLQILFIAAIAVLIFISAVNYRNTLAVKKSAQWISHTYKVQIQLEELVSRLKDAERGIRNYLTTNDTLYLQSLHQAHPEVMNSFSNLKTLTIDNPTQQQNLDSLSVLINSRFANLQEIVKLNEYKPIDTARLNVVFRSSKNIMDRMRKHVDKMLNLEKEFLKNREDKYESEISFTPLFTFILLGFSLVLLIFSYLKITRDLEASQKATDEFLIASEAIRHAEEIGNFGTWKWDMQTNKITYSDNAFRILGAEPQSFDPSDPKILEFIYPDDLQSIVQATSGMMKATEGVATTAYYRVIRADKELRYFKWVAKKITNTQGKETVVGISSDITDQHLSNLALEEKNRILQQNNQELAAFNHISSHDLQEPLRKIETFISRLSDTESETMSEKGKQFLSKIQNSAQRMRRLINDLLLFSNTGTAEKVFATTDLNVLLQNTQQELAQLIEEKNATIESNQLPTFEVIPFQIQQLFTNLIGNSLKYSKKDVPPIIKINCETVFVAPNSEALKTKTEKKYYRITIKDNGLGFEAQHAENIFNLFHRLHQTADYPGTGIGLSICRKIVENHQGFIRAEGVPNEGATFTIFLPSA